MTIILDGRAMTDRSGAHSHLAEKLDLPAWYGRNLDALYDVLTAYSGDILLSNAAAVTEHLGQYGEALLDTIREAAEENPNLTVAFE